jgi:hypothetical protein
MLKHKGGSMTLWDAQGNPTGTLHYGKDLNFKCKDCGAEPNNLCTTVNGKRLGKTHKGRGEG